MLKDFRDWFWTDSFWLPYGFKWDDVKECPLSGLYVTPLLTVVILMVRFLFERFIAIKLCTFIGITCPANNCEAKDSDTDITANGRCDGGGKTRNFRKSRRQQQIAKFQKATETCWRCFAYFLLFALGAYVIFSSDWFWDRESWLVGYIKNQHFDDSLRWYYMTELSFYMALMITHFSDTKRKDYLQQFVHHVATIILIAGSYLIAHFRYGSVIMLLHDTSDYWLEAAKLAKYARKQRLCDSLFVIFALLFFLTRWVYFPFWICFPWWRDNARLAGPLQSYLTFPYLFLYLCFVLLALHIYWGFLILRMIYNFTKTGTVEKDQRSEDDDSE